jgi:predicted ATPase
LIERRKLLHERIGAVLEKLYADSLDDHLADLAHHYGRSNNPDKAVEYLGRAAQQAESRSAFNEATAYARAGIALIPSIPPATDRDRRELTLQLVVGGVVQATQGWSAVEPAVAFSRARVLAEQTNDAREFQILLGLSASSVSRADSQEALAFADRMLELAPAMGNSSRALLAAHYLRGLQQILSGELVTAR